MTGTWFTRRRGLATGIVVSGASVGGIVWPVAIEQLMANVGLDWANRIVGFVILILLGCSAFLVRPKVKPPKQKVEFSSFGILPTQASYLLRPTRCCPIYAICAITGLSPSSSLQLFSVISRSTGMHSYLQRWSHIMRLTDWPC
jgi:MFS family permease